MSPPCPTPPTTLLQHSHLPKDAAQQLRWLDLQNDHLRMRVLNFGAITARLDLRSEDHWQPMVLGYRDAAAYLGDPFYLGAIVGRLANRVGGASFHVLDQRISLDANEGTNQLHGGTAGLGRVFWDIQQANEDTVELRYVSVAGENGYPGRAEIMMQIKLSESGVTYDMSATVDQATPINLAQHNYYTLGVNGDIWGHRLYCEAEHYLRLRQDGTPTGEMASVVGSRFDYSTGRSFGRLDPMRQGTDTHVIFPKAAVSTGADQQREVARLVAPNGMGLRVCSDQPGAQIYTARHLDSTLAAQEQQRLRPFSAVCIEPQGFPDAVNQPGFPSVMVHPDAPYRQSLTLTFTQGEDVQND
ncbi:aldose epimerase family protein [Phaeobacter porticola]|uniref:Aldose 1-epimerase n=1 Tax=Phaeobacter porticola TaxID=1844006 RepID=A0A1L3IA17_9RHOB|nr:aldose epimerase family protein [Phaeobacter porticola]APG48945.1 aldose 1-epimerase [Phaeobacter porticola]